MLLYVTLGTNELARATTFYDAAFAALGFVRIVSREHEVGYGPPTPPAGERAAHVFVGTPYDKGRASHGNGAMLALDAPSRAAVDAFHAAALAAGGSDEGKPGLRAYHASFYACYVRDPDGNKLSAVHEKPV